MGETAPGAFPEALAVARWLTKITYRSLREVLTLSLWVRAVWELFGTHVRLLTALTAVCLLFSEFLPEEVSKELAALREAPRRAETLTGPAARVVRHLPVKLAAEGRQDIPGTVGPVVQVRVTASPVLVAEAEAVVQETLGALAAKAAALEYWVRVLMEPAVAPERPLAAAAEVRADKLALTETSHLLPDYMVAVAQERAEASL